MRSVNAAYLRPFLTNFVHPGEAGSHTLPPMLWPLPLPGPSMALALRAGPSGLVMLGSCLAFAFGALVPDHS